MELLKETWKQRPFSYEAFTQFKERKFTGRYVNVDQNGFRVSKDQGVWPPDPENYNVFLFGGSTTFGYGVPDHQTIASYLQESLQDKMGSQVKVYNFGRGFYYWFQERILFERLLTSGYVPHMVIFIDGLNGPGNSTIDKAFFTPRFKKILEKEAHQNFFSKLMKKLKSAVRSMPIITVVSLSILDKKSKTVSKGIIDRYISNKEVTEAVAAVYKVTPIFVWQPLAVYNYDLSYHPLSEKDSLFLNPKRYEYKYMAEMINKKNFGDNFLWCADIQENVHEPLYVDINHYSAKMSKMLAETITKILIEKNILIPVSIHKSKKREE